MRLTSPKDDAPHMRQSLFHVPQTPECYCYIDHTGIWMRGCAIIPREEYDRVVLGLGGPHPEPIHA